jgi:hypothetical protein
MKHLDFTIDFETCAMSADAAPMQVAVVPWRRDAENNPFAVADDLGEITEDEAARWPDPYVGYVDLRTCVMDGMDFDPATIRWWSERTDAAKRAVCEELAEPVEDITVGILDYIRNTTKELRTESVCLWAQGTDFDISIIRSLCRRFDIDLEDIVPHTSFRDCRTVILEAAYKQACQQRLEAIATAETLLQDGTPVPCPAVSPQEVLAGSRKAYNLFPPLPSQYDGCQHDALYDAIRSTWYTWQALKNLRQ